MISRAAVVRAYAFPLRAPFGTERAPTRDVPPLTFSKGDTERRNAVEAELQEYLAHKKQPPPRALQKDYVQGPGPHGGPREKWCFL